MNVYENTKCKNYSHRHQQSKYLMIEYDYEDVLICRLAQDANEFVNSYINLLAYATKRPVRYRFLLNTGPRLAIKVPSSLNKISLHESSLLIDSTV
jgi:hypothetical protein